MATSGSPLRYGVVNALSLPCVVPALLVATMRKWYVVLAIKPLIFALTF